jgi:hypothetical protein
MYMPLQSIELDGNGEVTSVIVLKINEKSNIRFRESYSGDDVIIEQSMNMTDCEDVEMYEGDVIDDPEELLHDGSIEFYNGCYGVEIMYEMIFTPLEGWTDEWTSKVKVIGNIHFLEAKDNG